MTYADDPTPDERNRERIARLEARGDLVPGCAGCRPHYAGPSVMAPWHTASPDCESGSRPHCTCPACWG